MTPAKPDHTTTEEETKETPRKRGRKPGTKSNADNGLPIFLRGRVARSKVYVRALCEGPDAETYKKYLEYSLEATKDQGLTLEELEIRFNAAAWGSIWSRDAGFRAFLKKDADSAKSAE